MKLKVRFTPAKLREDRLGGRSELSRRVAAESRPRQTQPPMVSQVVPMPSYTIPECIPAHIHAVGAAWAAFHTCETPEDPSPNTHPPVTSGGHGRRPARERLIEGDKR